MLTKPISKLQEVDVLHKSDLLLLETGTNAKKLNIRIYFLIYLIMLYLEVKILVLYHPVI